MQNSEIQEIPQVSFTEFIKTRFYAGENSEVVVGSYWLPFLGELYLAIKSASGLVKGMIYVDGGLMPSSENGAQFRRVTIASEADGSPYIHCSMSLIAELSDSKDTKTILWRQCSSRWDRDYQTLKKEVARLNPGEVIQLFADGQTTPSYFGSLNQFNSIAGPSWPDTLTLVNSLGRGYQIRIVPAR